MILAVLLAAAMPQAAPIAPPRVQGSADCVHPVYATDQLVCEDPPLAALDRRMTDLLKLLPADRLVGRWIEDQWAWFRRSRMCAFKADQAACVTAAYNERIAVLSALSEPPPSGSGPCVTSDGAATGHRQVTMIAAANVVAVAVEASRAWRPFVSLEKTRRANVLRDSDSNVILRCAVEQW